MKTCRCVLVVQGEIQGGACGGVGVFVPPALQSEAPPLPLWRYKGWKSESGGVGSRWPQQPNVSLYRAHYEGGGIIWSWEHPHNGAGLKVAPPPTAALIVSSSYISDWKEGLSSLNTSFTSITSPNTSTFILLSHDQLEQIRTALVTVNYTVGHRQGWVGQSRHLMICVRKSMW